MPVEMLWIGAVMVVAILTLVVALLQGDGPAQRSNARFQTGAEPPTS